MREMLSKIWGIPVKGKSPFAPQEEKKKVKREKTETGEKQLKLK